MNKTLFFLIFQCCFLVSGAQIIKLDTLLKIITPNNVKIQYAGNIGMFSSGIGYTSPNKRWEGNLLYGYVPAKYAVEPIHSATIKGKFSSLLREYADGFEIKWLQIGLWYNYSFGDPYFFKLPSYYDSGYYYFSTAVNVGLTVGSEFRYKRWGLYYELGTTEKRTINYVKNLKSVGFNEIWNIGLGAIYYIK
ncbi:hypothetical protein [Sphingobacterium sp. LRF_L2]|uniref:hypothetical protein n=1 Tax=Sphingobacterium sp. LRF_L2 TaxID=3369421 RepID=UPI003F614D4A